MSKKLIYLLSFVLVLGLANNASSQPTGEILVEWWLGIGGDELTRLTGIADFPDNPTGSSTLNTLEVPRSNRPAELSVLDNNYGARLQGCIWPPASGDYTFWITGDNNSQFWLSTDADPANVVMMCEVPGVNSTGSREWTKFPVQKSDAVTLKGGRAYYFDVLFKEGGGGDGVAVGWGGPTIGAGPVVIEGDYLSGLVQFHQS